MTFCILAENCTVFDRHANTSGLSRHNPLCEGCRNRSKRELNLLRYDYVDLSQLIAKQGGLSEAKISRPKPESSPTVDLSVLTLRSEMTDTAMWAEFRLRTHLGMLHTSAPVREGYGLSQAVYFLEPRVDALARMPAADGHLSGAELLLLVGMLHRRARKVCGLDPRTIQLPGLCPSCSVPSLRRHDDDPERVWCAACNMQLAKEAYYAAQRMQFAPVTPASEAR